MSVTEAVGYVGVVVANTARDTPEETSPVVSALLVEARAPGST
jgi:hypothetical protein